MSIHPLSTNQREIPSSLLTQNNGKKLHSTEENPKTAVAPVDAGVEKSLSGISVPESRKLFNDQIIAALEKTLSQSSNTSIYELNPEDYSPEKVANRILSFVGAAFANIDSEDKEGLNNRLDAARAGIEKGFNEAKDILEGLGVFKENIEKNANNTYERLQSGLDTISANIQAGNPITQGLFETQQNSQSSLSVLLTQSFNFELTTADGDKVSIKIDKLDAATESSDGSSRLSQAGYQLSIEGDIDAEEQKAIDNLLAEMTAVADTYFSGNTQAALEQVNNMGYNTSEIASFTLNLREVQQTKATSAYQTINELPEGNSPMSSLSQVIMPLKDYAAQLLASNNLFSEVVTSTEDTSQYLRLLEQVARINDRFTGENKLSQMTDLNEELIERSLST